MTSTAPEQAQRPDTNLGWSLAVVLRRWHERVESVLDDIPHGSRGYHVLIAVSAGEPPAQAALAERLLIDRSVMTYLLDDLEEADLVRRRVDPGDRRVRRVCATEHGRRVLVEVRERVDQAEEHVLAGLDAPTRELFRGTVQRAAVAIAEASPDTDPCVAVRQVVDGEEVAATPDDSECPGDSGRPGAADGPANTGRPEKRRRASRGSRG